MSGDVQGDCRVERLPSGSWPVTLPDGLVSFHATEGLARRAAERWRRTGRHVDALIGAAGVPDGSKRPDDA